MVKEGVSQLVTLRAWFLAPDGQQYRAFWGKCEIMNKNNSSFSYSKPSTWMIQCGQLRVRGKDVFLSIECDQPPLIKDGTYVDKDTKEEIVHNKIYIPEAFNG